ncbi:OX-2 membrane glycoprotein-like isoform X2 [Poecilia latipinna]|uniref:OX-2 membrane glycoprotein-like isoform X2 n=1 Tax=Poecilia latipinna TaxID=48699 RepID=UPI00072E51C5|nr:PREDICTED: OX-2 membrane glycoprotein-like isoform X2 [Poecilia latipinna]
MEHILAVPILFFLLVIFSKGLAAVIQTQQTVSAAVGEDAPLSCQLLETKDVQQVTWQKVLERTERNIGSYSEYYGETVNDGFRDKVQFTEAKLQKNSIVIRNITDQDEGCYLCLFNTYPDGALTGRTCLIVYELDGPFINIRNYPPGSVVTCSATGRPVPMVTLTVLHQNLSFSHYNTSRETNTNGTVTVTTTALLSALSSSQVGCSVSVHSAAPRELMVTVPGLAETSDERLDKQSPSYYHALQWALIAAVMAVMICLAILLGIRFQRRNKKPSEDTTENQNLDDSPVSNKDVRLRTSERQRQNSEDEKRVEN